MSRLSLRGHELQRMVALLGIACRATSTDLGYAIDRTPRRGPPSGGYRPDRWCREVTRTGTREPGRPRYQCRFGAIKMSGFLPVDHRSTRRLSRGGSVNVLTQAQRQQFEDEGCIVVHNVLDRSSTSTR